MPEFETPLDELAFRYGSDKTPLIKHHYTAFYYDYFKDRQASIKKVLEIGVGDQNEMLWTMVPNYVTGASLRMWRDFFPNAQVYGADIKDGLVFELPRLKTFYCDQSKADDLRALIAQTGTDIDIMIDDGSHKPEHQVLGVKTLMPLLQRSVVYFIEDVGHPQIAEQLTEYDVRAYRPSRMSNRDDRILIVRHKHGQ